MKPAVALALMLPWAPVASQSPSTDSILANVYFESVANLILIDVEIEGEPFVFLLDTGASSIVLSKDVAERLDLPMSTPRTRAQSATRGELTYRYVESLDFEIGGYEITLPQVLIAPFEPSARAMIGRTVHGILGYEFVRRHVLAIDYEECALTIHDPVTYRYRGEGSELPLAFDVRGPRMPFATVGFETASGEVLEFPLLVDSGGSVLATCSLGPLASGKVLAPDALRVPQLGATGLSNTPEGAMHTTFLTRLPRLQIGPYSIPRPVSTCHSKRPGFDLFGAELLRRFDVVIDYRNQRLILEPNGRFEDPCRADRSGTLLVGDGEDPSRRRIQFVVPGGPADQVGLQVGDEILTIDGEPAASRSLHQTRMLFFELGSFDLRIRRGDREWDVTLVTRDLL